MPDCPLADQCPSFSERIEGMGCMHYGDRGGAEWCQHYNKPIRDLKQQPVTPGEEVVVEVTDIHESGAGVGRTDDGFIVMVDGLLPEARAKVRITRVHSNHATGEEVERLPLDPEEEEADDETDTSAGDESDAEEASDADADDDEADDDEADEAAAEADDEADDEEDSRESKRPRGARRERLGSRDNFWGN